MLLFLQATPPASRLTPDQMQRVSLLTLIVALVGLLFVIGAVSILLERRRRRLKAARTGRHGRRLDPWEVAGQRAEPPSARDLEDDDTEGGNP